MALLNLGFVALHQDRVGDALELLREAAEGFRALGDLEVTAHALNGLAAACAEERPEVAARLLGSAAALREDVGATQDFEPGIRSRALGQVRAILGEARFAAAYEEGRALAPEQAVALSTL